MTSVDYIALLPLIVTAYSGAVVMAIIAFWRSQKAAFGLTLISLAAAFATIFVALSRTPRAVTPLLQIDVYSLFFTGLILASTLVVTLLCPRYVPAHQKRGEALYVLMIFSVLGMITVAASHHFVSFFLGLETLSVSLYGLIGFTRRYRPSIEAAIKYLVLAATASAFLLFGIALVYMDAGTMDFRTLAPTLMGGDLSVISFFGIVMIIVAFGFKLAFVPFHMWSPDVYQGSPTPVTALIATGSKGAVFALLLRFVTMTGLTGNSGIYLVLTVLAIATMFGGNLLALLQPNVKRILAYSSIAHMGYLLIPLIAGGARGPSSIAFYLVSYFATTIAAFGVIAVLSSTKQMGDVESLEDYRGLSSRNPVLAMIFTLALLSLAGIPLTAGFFAKFYIFNAAVQSRLWMLLIIGVVNSGMSAFYYLRIVAAMYAHGDTEHEPFPTPTFAEKLALGISTVVVVFFGVYPSPLIRLAEAATRVLR